MKKFFISLLLLPILVGAAVYDCFTFFNELDLLTLRLEELYNCVDHFVIVEARESFTGKPKPLYFAENAHRFKKYQDKIIHIVIEEFPDLSGNPEKDHWYREEYSRNAFLEGLKECRDDDIIFISDLDEIPSAEAMGRIQDYFKRLERIKGEKHRARSLYVCNLQMRLFAYQMNHENLYEWLGGAKATPYWMVKKHTPWGIKLYHHSHRAYTIENAGWHFSTMGGKEKALYKWVNTGPIHDNELWANELNRLSTDEHLLEVAYRRQLDHNTIPVPIDETFPKYFLENIDYFRSIGWVD